jgi:hypothetical protein
MPKISYNFTIPKDKYDSFKEEISQLAQDFDLTEKVIFDDDKGSCKFLFSADLIEKFFISKIENGEEKYPFFCCNPANYQNCERRENGKIVSFKDARENELKIYERLKLKRKSQLVLSQDILQKGEFDFESDLIIGEYHPDPLPKEFLIKFMESCQLRTKPIIAIERFPAALNEELQRWLKDESESELPNSIKAYCQFVDMQNNGEKLEFTAGRNCGTLQLLCEAKKHGFDVIFFESEHSSLSCHSQVNRHECLVTSLFEIKQNYSDRNFLVLAGAYHDNPSFEVVTMSRALNAKSCTFFSPELEDVFLSHKEKFLSRGDLENAKIYEEMAKQMQENNSFAQKAAQRAKDSDGKILFNC